MPKCLGRIGWGLLLLTLLASSGRAQSLTDKVMEHHFANGLTLLLYERHQAPIIACRIYVNVGSVNDISGQTGVAHMTEHIAFKGTPTIGTTDYAAEKVALAKVDDAWRAIVAEQIKGSQTDAAKLQQLQADFKTAQAEAGKYVISEAYSQILEENGGVGLNASTSRDSTQYFVNLPANRLELWMMLEADRLMHTVPREFYQERDVIQEERRMRTDTSPIETLIEQFLGAAFIAHPYGLPAIGWPSDIQAMMPEQLMAFLNTYYTPSNMVIAIVGDIDPPAVIRLAEQYFGQLPPGPPAPPLRTIEPEQPGERRVTVEWDANPFLIMGYHRPAVNHPDDLVFDVISSILTGGRTGRLYKKLVEEQQIAVQVDSASAYPGQKYPTLFMLVGVPLAPHTLTELETALDAEIERLQTTPVEAHELEKVINNIEAGFIDSLSSNAGLAAQLTLAQSIMGDWRSIEQRVATMKNVTAEDVMRVAKTYFTKRNRTIGWLVQTPAQPQK
jgi:predicted Zn-dependent peptidase